MSAINIDTLPAEIAAQNTPVFDLAPSEPTDKATAVELISTLLARGWTKTRIAREIGRDPAQTTRIAQGKQTPSPETHKRLVALVESGALLNDPIAPETGASVEPTRCAATVDLFGEPAEDPAPAGEVEEKAAESGKVAADPAPADESDEGKRPCVKCGAKFHPPKAAPTAVLCRECYEQRKRDLDGLAETARGHWPEILVHFGIDREHLRDHHGPCPGCGGSDRFRFDNDSDRGTWVCGGGGDTQAGDGFALLSHVYGWSAGESFLKVAAYFGIDDPSDLPPPDPALTAKREAEAESARAQEQEQQERTARHAAQIWEAASVITAETPNPYLSRKGVHATDNLRQIEVEAVTRIIGYHPTATKDDTRQRLQGVVLVVPYRRDGELTTVELIDGNGCKAALKGKGTKRAAFWLARPVAEDDHTILVAEGVATALSVLEATGYPVAASGSVGNMHLTAARLKSTHYPARVILAADLKKRTSQTDPVEPIEAAVKAAHKFRTPLPLVFPEVGPLAPLEVSDFNDLHQIAGIDVLRGILARSIADFVSPLTESDVTGVTDVTPSHDAGCSGYATENADVTGVTRLPKPTVKRPGFAVHDDWTGYGKPGVWWHSTKDKGEVLEEVNQWICTPLYADAITHGDRDADFGLLLRFKNALGREREWSMPMAMLRGSGEELRGELLALGVRIDPIAHRLLNQYLMSRYPKARVMAATCTGWHGEGKVFVLPHRILGEGNVRYQSEHADHDEFVQAGTFDDWRAEIAARCTGNPMLVLAVAASLAGPLLARVHRTGCGLHFHGDSSIGKSTLLALSASCWGGAGFIRTWRATSNGIEGTAAMLNDTALILDEISEVDPREVGAIVYSVGNGTGKSRAARTGGARAVKRWRVVLLSSGERTLIATMEEGGKRAKAGQEARLLDIPCTRKHGVFDVLHGFDGGRALTDTLKTAVNRHHGHAGPAFVERLIADGRDLGETLAQVAALPEFTAETGIEGRAANAFALIAMAGELAIEWGIVPWSEGEALDAAALAFRLWRDHRGKGQTETRQILRSIADFIARHGDARFSPLHPLRDDGIEITVRDRAGWWRERDDERVYLFTPAGLKEAASGFDQRRILDALDSSGWIADRDPGERSKVTNAQGRKLRLYAITPKEDDAL